MTQIRISLDPTSPIHRELEEEILNYVKSLENVDYKTTVLPAQPGKLGNVDLQTIIITVELSAAVISFLAALIDLINQTHSAHQHAEQRRDGKPSSKDVEILVNDIKISLPVSDETARKNLHKVSISIGETKEPKSPRSKKNVNTSASKLRKPGNSVKSKKK